MSSRGTSNRLDGRFRYWVSQMLMHGLRNARYTSGCDGVLLQCAWCLCSVECLGLMDSSIVF